LTTQEAVLSSRIEGTQATLGEVLEFEAEGNPEDESSPKTADIHEIQNYRAALREATNLLDSLPLSQRLIKRTHEVLMRGVRGRNKAPGEYRRIPNWIGPDGCAIEQARFIPVGADKLEEAMNRWEIYLHETAPDLLIQLAVAHAEFEAIHPFLDGNGRLGRLIIPLFMRSKGLLSRPNFYLSAYFEKNRDEYYYKLRAVSEKEDWTGWVEFFLRAIVSQAEENQIKSQDIINLYQYRKDWIAVTTHSQYGVRALDWIFTRPIFKTSDFVSNADIPRATAIRIMRLLKSEGMLREIRPGGGRRAAVMAFPELLNIAEGRPLL
jgi:Fic family protein